MSGLSDGELRRAVAKVDLLLKRRQAFWETPRNLAVIVGVASAIIGVLAGVTGFQLGSRPPQKIEASVHLEQPLRAPVP